MACDWGKLLEQLQGQTKTKIQALDTLQVTAGPLLAAGWRRSARAGATAPQPSTDAAAQNHVQTTALGRDNISSLLDYTPQLLSDNNFKASWLKEGDAFVNLRPQHRQLLPCAIADMLSAAAAADGSAGGPETAQVLAGHRSQLTGLGEALHPWPAAARGKCVQGKGGGTCVLQAYCEGAEHACALCWLLSHPQVERLGDNKQDVRQAACDLLLDLLQVSRSDSCGAALRQHPSHA